MRTIMLLFLLGSIAILPLFAQEPQVLNYQGIVSDETGNPSNGTFSIQFAIYNAPAEGAALWTEIREIEIIKGNFSVLLGETTPFPVNLFSKPMLYLGVRIGEDPEMTPRQRLGSVGSAFYTSFSDSTGKVSASNGMLTLNSIQPQKGNIDLVAGDNISLTPNPDNHTITINATATSGGGDNLGSHSATKNIKLNDHYISNDGDDEGINILNNGSVNTSSSLTVKGALYAEQKIVAAGNIQSSTQILCDGSIIVGPAFSSYGTGDICASNNILANHDVAAVRDVKANRYVYAKDGITTGGFIDGGTDMVIHGNIRSEKSIVTGTPSTSYSNGCIVSTNDVKADNNITAGDVIEAGGNIISGGNIQAGGKIEAGGDILADGTVKAADIKTGNPSSSVTPNSIASTNDLFADDDLVCGGTKSAFVESAGYGSYLFYCEEATEVWFIERGAGQLVNGVAQILLDPQFSAAITVGKGSPMRVQVTLTGDCNGVFVTGKSANGFTVKELMNGKSNATFDWEIACKRKSHENERMESVQTMQ